MGLHKVFFFGEPMQEADRVCHAECRPDLCLWTDRIENLVDSLTAEIRSGDLVLVKGSRGVALERVLTPLAGVAV
jgi:UDP-N-acetylmuramyl pentapeptide synthase